MASFRLHSASTHPLEEEQELRFRPHTLNTLNLDRAIVSELTRTQAHGQVVALPIHPIRKGGESKVRPQRAASIYTSAEGTSDEGKNAFHFNLDAECGKTRSSSNSGTSVLR